MKLLVSNLLVLTFFLEAECREVNAPAGKFRGSVQKSLQGQLYVAFLGIPFAEPPVGELRFAKPKPYPKIKGTYDATKTPPICIQPQGVDLGGPGQEDCLYLNVYLPITPIQEDEKRLRKVFVYIHGGSYFMGSANEYVPGDLVSMGDVIVVTFNYRLSWLGFLKGDTPELPGNQGLWDQLLALQWVKDNIKAFGGDPHDITLGGNSMGGESVSALSIIPQGRGLFTKGLIMSGTMFTCPSTPKSSDVLFDLLTTKVGCGNTAENPKNNSAIVECLRYLPASSFILPLEGHLTNKFTTIDGELFSAPIGTLIADQSYLESVGFYERNYIVSLVNNEGAVEYHGPFHIGMEADDLTAEFLSQKFRLPVQVCQSVLDWYKMANNSYIRPGYDILGDQIIGLPAFKFLETFAANTENTMGESFFLWFDHFPSYLPSTLQGMLHGVDLTYLFDLEPKDVLRFYFNLKGTKDFTEEDFKLKRVYIRMLTDFMRNIHPGSVYKQEFDLEWPKFDLESEFYLNLGSQPSIKQFPLYYRRKLWDVAVPQLMEEYAERGGTQGKDEL
ncbi:acetylcholinesterase-1-like [Physella acuta]|uniref:acetylcholinesterase-1-like n=1 Tax=Physella acuta TaxID=109671 RepID=UPI0027DB04C7|nr:acetylcholinesterase-1-like [Physella acuta]